MRLIPFATFVLSLSSVACFAEMPPIAGSGADDEFEVGKHYRVIVREMDGDEAVTTTYWATVTQADGQRIVLGDGEWSQHTGPVTKPRGTAFLIRVSSRIYRALGQKPVIGLARGFPMGEETVALKRSQITEAKPMTETEFRLRKESRQVSRPRPPHASEQDAG